MQESGGSGCGGKVKMLMIGRLVRAKVDDATTRSSIMPPISLEEAIETTKIHSIADS